MLSGCAAVCVTDRAMSECLITPCTCDPLQSWRQPPHLPHVIRDEVDYLPERALAYDRVTNGFSLMAGLQHTHRPGNYSFAAISNHPRSNNNCLFVLAAKQLD